MYCLQKNFYKCDLAYKTEAGYESFPHLVLRTCFDAAGNRNNESAQDFGAWMEWRTKLFKSVPQKVALEMKMH